MPARHRVEITATAQADVQRIREYIAQDSEPAAQEFVEALLRQVDSLERFPLRCPVIPEAGDVGFAYRHLIHGNYRTVFRVDGSTVWILRVIHGSQLLDTSLLE